MLFVVEGAILHRKIEGRVHRRRNHHVAPQRKRFAAEALRLGLPLMVKAAAGGGGRGMRLVTQMDQLPAAVAGARSEALSVE